MTNLYLLAMVTAGAAVATQIAINARLGMVTGSALWTANISFAVTMLIGIAALVIALLLGSPAPSTAALAAAPRWIWLGGVGGASYVVMAIVLADRLGAALLSAAGILGQLGLSLLIDHYGWFGMPVHRLSSLRLVGLALLIAGVALIRSK
jgi:bacterial/archaeal transporter family-2 protein